MASISIIDKNNHQRSHLKHFVVQTRSFQIEKSRNFEMYPRLRIYIQKQNEKRKQEMEMSEELKRAKREKELKHNQDKLTLGEIKEEISKNERRMIELENEKHRLFADFKKVLNEDDSRKNLQRQKEAAAIAITNLQFGPPPPTQSNPTTTIVGSMQTQSSTISLNSNISSSSLKFGLPPPLTVHTSGPSITNPAVIPNSAMLLPPHPYFPHPSSLPPPLSAPMAIITSSGSAPSLSFSQQHRSVNPVPSSSFSHKPLLNNPPPSIYSKPIAAPSIGSTMLPMTQSPSNNPIITGPPSSVPHFHTIAPSNDRQRSLSYKNLPGSGHQPPQMSAFLPGYGKQPVPPLSSLPGLPQTQHHPGPPPGAGPPPPGFSGLPMDPIHGMQMYPMMPFMMKDPNAK